MSDTDNQPINRLKIVRESLGLTQTEFGKKLDFKLNKIRDIEIGKQKISPEIAIDIEKKFSISFKWLLTGLGDMFVPRKGVSRESATDYCLAVNPKSFKRQHLHNLLSRILDEDDEAKIYAVEAQLKLLAPPPKDEKPKEQGIGIKPGKDGIKWDF